MQLFLLFHYLHSQLPHYICSRNLILLKKIEHYMFGLYPLMLFLPFRISFTMNILLTVIVMMMMMMKKKVKSLIKFSSCALYIAFELSDNSSFLSSPAYFKVDQFRTIVSYLNLHFDLNIIYRKFMKEEKEACFATFMFPFLSLHRGKDKLGLQA